MNLVLSLTEAEEAKLLAKAKAEGSTVEQVVRQALAPIVASVADASATQPSNSLLGIWAKCGPGPTAEEIDQNRAEMFSTFLDDKA